MRRFIVALVENLWLTWKVLSSLVTLRTFSSKQELSLHKRLFQLRFSCWSGCCCSFLDRLAGFFRYLHVRSGYLIVWWPWANITFFACHPLSFPILWWAVYEGKLEVMYLCCFCLHFLGVLFRFPCDFDSSKLQLFICQVLSGALIVRTNEV